MLKKVVLLFLFLCLVCCGCGKKQEVSDDLAKILQRDELIIGVRNDAAPFGYINEKGELSGFDVDLAKIITQSVLGDANKVKFVPVTASDRIMKLNSGEVDMLIATMSITLQRQQILDFSIPYYTAGQAVLVKSSSKATSLKDFKKLIIVFGSTSEKNLRQNLPEVTILGYKNYNDAFSALKADKADGIVADDTILLGFAMKDKSVKLLPKRYSKEPYAIAFRKDNDSKRLQEKVDLVVETILNNGKINRLKEKWNIK